MVEKYPNLKKEVGGLIPVVNSPLYLTEKTCHVVKCLLHFGIGISAFSLKNMTPFLVAGATLNMILSV